MSITSIGSYATQQLPQLTRETSRLGQHLVRELSKQSNGVAAAVALIGAGILSGAAIMHSMHWIEHFVDIHVAEPEDKDSGVTIEIGGKDVPAENVARK